MAALPERHQRKVAPILTIPASLVALAGMLILRFTAWIAGLLLLMGAVGGLFMDDSTVLEGLWEMGKLVFFIWGGVIIATGGAMMITDTNDKYVQAQEKADQIRLARQILDEEDGKA